jgi:hypothetical protein
MSKPPDKERSDFSVGITNRDRAGRDCLKNLGAAPLVWKFKNRIAKKAL